ncbi:unnamed protein product [Rotaria magnacalcarata]|uniref:Uncharacterized protein n=2 Tax=Rotaria magnacalcarata TaxID=392030 RepID=A0A816N1G3_9BILA|nr:unnamed protein product [Rotaria magnacalcarata]CAF3788073.1 unnamed protein product [Rotaria magnacalcarata]CAF3829397.1 unnamed protein product [Rotaria magnacalcarata]CAF4567598.1 unnamed protein product [Rotaria magnacalcarata]
MISQVSIWDENKISPEKNTCIKTNEWHIDRKGASYKSLYSGRTTFLSMALVGALLAGIGLAHHHWHRQHYQYHQCQQRRQHHQRQQRQQRQQHRRHRRLLLPMSTVIHALRQATVDPVTLVPLRAMVVSSLASAIRNRGQPSTHQ